MSAKNLDKRTDGAVLRLLSEFHQKQRTALTWWQKLLDLRNFWTYEG